MIVALAPLVAMFALVILAACANVASLMVARGVARQRELGVRLAIGAGRGRVVRQLLTESLLLALPAAAVGIGASRLMIDAVLRIMMVAIPDSFLSSLRMAPLVADSRVYWFVAAVAVGSAVLFGLLPALQATRPDLVRATRGELGDDLKPSRIRRFLVTAQIGVAALLLIATGILFRTNQRGKQLSLGFDPTGVMVIRVADQARDRVIQHLREWSPAGAVASTSMVPMIEGTWAVSVQRSPTDTLVPASALEVSADFFSTLRIPLRSGRPFTEDEATGVAPVAIVNETMARRLSDQTVILTRPGPGQEPVTRTLRVVGVAPDIATAWIGFGTAQPTIFLPGPLAEPKRGLLVRVVDGTPASARQLEERLEATDPGAVDRIFPLRDAFVVSTFPLVLGTWIGLVVGAIALFLTLSGVYGVMAFTVARRSREIGVRIALGASAGRVVRLVLRETMTLAGWGIGVGAVLAAAVAAGFASAIELVHVHEPLVYLAGAAVVMLSCLLGAAVPSRRAARVQPLEAIRAE
jgi:predicted permease